jgi:hypothetical protein
MQLVKLIIKFAFTLLICLNASVKTKESYQDQTISLCDFLKSPSVYDNKAVTLKASYFSSRESFYLYDMSCDKGAFRVYPILTCTTDTTCTKLREKLGKELSGNVRRKRVNLTLQGRFKQAENDHSLFGCRYCPQGDGYRFAFEVTEIQKAMAIINDEEWPK